MDMERKAAREAAYWYLSVSAAVAVIFFVLARLGKYPPVALYGGAVWVFILTLIIAMPVIIPRIKRKYQQ